MGVGTGSNASIDKHVDSPEMAGEVCGAEARVMDKAAGLLYEHPDYIANADKWSKYLDCYEASDIYKYIKQHTRESDDIFENRISRGYYYNYCASVVDLFVAYLFHAPIVRDPKNDQDKYQALYENADLAGTKYVYFLEIVATFAQIFGHVGVLVDAPQIPEGGFNNEAERLAANARPYLTIVRADQIKDWELDNQGNFVWVKIEVCRPEPDRAWNVEVDCESRSFIIWTRDHWEEWRVTGAGSNPIAVQVATQPHGLGAVPLVIVRNEKMPSHPWFGCSSLRDIADINLAILNWSSLGDEEIAERCLNILTMEADQSDAAVTLSHSNVLTYAPGATPPAYLTPGTTPLELIGKWIDRAKDEIYRLAKLGGSTGLLGVREATSGIAYAYEFNETNQSLARKAESLEQAEYEIHRLYAKWLNSNFDGTILYPKEFGVDDFLTEFQILAEGRNNLTSETAIKELQKKTVGKLFARESMELRAKIVAEIEASDSVPVGVAESFATVPGALTNGSGAPKKPGSSGSSTGSAG